MGRFALSTTPCRDRRSNPSGPLFERPLERPEVVARGGSGFVAAGPTQGIRRIGD